MARFLETNGPWDLLVKLNHIQIERFKADMPMKLNDRLSLTPIAVPHRDEYSDTFGFIVTGPARKVLWLPDIDKWERWESRIEDVIAGVDAAYVDGTFFDAQEMPGRAPSSLTVTAPSEKKRTASALQAEPSRKTARRGA